VDRAPPQFPPLAPLYLAPGGKRCDGERSSRGAGAERWRDFPRVFGGGSLHSPLRNSRFLTERVAGESREGSTFHFYESLDSRGFGKADVASTRRERTRRRERDVSFSLEERKIARMFPATTGSGSPRISHWPARAPSLSLSLSLSFSRKWLALSFQKYPYYLIDNPCEPADGRCPRNRAIRKPAAASAGFGPEYCSVERSAYKSPGSRSLGEEEKARVNSPRAMKNALRFAERN